MHIKRSKKPNFSFSKLFLYSLYFAIVLSFVHSQSYSQTISKPYYIQLLDSVKIYYGDTCCIGINSILIKHLYEFQKYDPVRNYLDEYEFVRKEIEGFRTTYIKTIYNEPALLVDLSRIFADVKQQNLVNLSGIYLGPDSVTSVALSYIILRTSPKKYNSVIYQIANFDAAFKNEITKFGDDWYNSVELKGIVTYPVK